MTTVVDAANPLTKPQEEKPKKPVNHIALVVDESGSMQWATNKVIQLVNEQLGTIKMASKGADQITTVSVYTLGDNRIKVHAKRAFPESVNFYNYRPAGNTPLYDAIQTAINDLRQAAQGGDESFLVIVFTDGEENASRFAGPPGSQIVSLQKLGTWSFAFMHPPGPRYRQFLLGMGVPVGNLKAWESTDEGIEEAGAQISAGIGSYYAGRVKGMTATASFFTDLSGISKTQINNLDDVKNQFKRWTVEKETDITSFVQSHGISYEPGRGYYELTKAETIQSHKDLVIGERRSKALHGGPEAKKLVGIHEGPGVVVKVKPGNHADYKIFVKSTSTNRKLVRGTEFLYRVD